ncbi:glycosyltransferase [Gimibacter soli]|uniref:Glycosyltransferase n=1 Tax=Gimibacter soli TaxID=3024400 RepID=A0AAE9XKX2_9PROT|nr:glycosyltransferase [Gimibacter soli]WCL53074.1 glycosyltransferase [Gimibacter soli]
MKQIIFLKGQSQYGSLRLHIDQAAEAAVALGYKPVVLDLTDEGVKTGFWGMFGGDNALILTQNIGGDLRFEGKSMAEVAGCPHCVMFVDHPAAQQPRVAAATKDQILTFLDGSHIKWVETMMPGKAGALALVPPGGNVKAPPPVDATVDEFMDRRDIPMLFTGTWHDHKGKRWAQHNGTPVGRLLDATFDIAMAHNMMPVEGALEAAMISIYGGVDPQVYKSLLTLSFHLSAQIHSTRRWDALIALAKAGAPVHLYGKGWEKHLYRFKSFTYGGEGTFEETLENLKRTRIVLNTNTNFVAGAHERVFAAQMAGAAVLSDVSSWYQTHFTDGSDIALFEWVSTNTVAVKAEELLTSPEKMHAIAAAGRTKTEAENSWKNRLQEILKIAEGIKVGA